MIYSPPLPFQGRGAGGLGRKPLPQPLPGTERGVRYDILSPLPFQGRGAGVRSKETIL